MAHHLSEQAAQDLEELYLWGLDRFGIEQADSYTDGLVTLLEQIGETPQLYQAVDWIRPGYRRAIYRSHAIFYVVMPNQDALIVRILGKQDLDSALH